ncbi:hypothetical protein, partial [Kitasatospora sp. NPDC057198]|uniref:hypothetical protein n=1 Tax=Kitasatospora sp. NPDC057198 TaxID=3346046 RepID=UPI00364145E9
MRANRLLAVTVLSVLGVTGLTACNSDGDGTSDAAPAASAPASATASAAAGGGGLEKLTVPEITEKSRAAGKKLTSAKLTAKVTDTEGDIEFSVAADGSGNCVGTVGIAGQGKAEIRRNADKVWMKPDAEFLKAIFPGKEEAAAAINGKWLASSKGEDVGGFAEFCDMVLQMQQKIGSNDDGSLDDKGTVTGTKKVGGVEAVILDIQDEDGAPMEAAIANTDEPYLLALDGKEQGKLQYSDFNKPVKVTAPPADQVV